MRVYSTGEYEFTVGQTLNYWPSNVQLSHVKRLDSVAECHRRRNRGDRGGLGPLTFLFEGAQYGRGPPTLRPMFELK